MSKEFSMARQPVYILADTSGSMNGESIEAMRIRIPGIISAMKKSSVGMDADSIMLELITFNKSPQVECRLASLDGYPDVNINVDANSPSFFGEALRLLEARFAENAWPEDYDPLLIILTDGKFSDTMLSKMMIPRIKKLGFAKIIAGLSGVDTDGQILRDLADEILPIDRLDDVYVRQTIEQ